jgi:selenoprotein W-related protein
MKPKITVEYCPKCGWLIRAAWIAQELLTTFVDDLQEVSLRPSEIAGAFKVYLDAEIIFDRKREGHFISQR